MAANDKINLSIFKNQFEFVKKFKTENDPEDLWPDMDGMSSILLLFFIGSLQAIADSIWKHEEDKIPDYEYVRK